jgi:hypothetical protein
MRGLLTLGLGVVAVAMACYFWRPPGTRSLINFAAGFMALAIACLLLLPSHIALSFSSGGIVRALGVNRVAFLLVLAIGVVALLVKLVKR